MPTDERISRDYSGGILWQLTRSLLAIGDGVQIQELSAVVLAVSRGC
jgi:hypothetical protein